METYSKDFALFIDGVRVERGISREDLIDDIISLSQYKRYLRGITAIPNNIVVEFADRLKYTISDFYSLFTKKHSREYNQISDIYYLLKQKRYEEALEACTAINYDLIVSSFNKLFYDFNFIFIQHKLGRVSNVHVLSIYSDLINYPSCLNNESFNMIEMNIMSQIAVISSTMENYEPAAGLYRILTSKNFDSIYSGEFSILPMIFYTTARVFYKEKKIDQVLSLTKQGLTFATKYETSNALPHLLLLNGLANKSLGYPIQAQISMKKCFLQLIILGNKDVYDSFLVTYKQNFDVPIEELLQDIDKLI